ncbi:MAG TPA: AAA family ATPase, partial [bacterium]|nr:AAA family ATPase [bacterium]
MRRRGGDAAGAGRVVYVCQECGYESAKWLGRCPGCEAWSTLVEEPVAEPGAPRRAWRATPSGAAAPTPIGEVTLEREPRLAVGLGEVDRVLGGGLVPGSLVLLGGDPGIGKSTLALQVAHHLAPTRTVLYVSG